MACLVDELINILEEEENVYLELKNFGELKKDILIRNDVPELEKLTAREQVAADTLLALSNRQIQVLTDIANVLGRSEDKMTVTKLIGLLDSEPATQSRLRVAKEKLCSQAEQVNSLNQQNAALLNQALELTEFDITLFKSMRQAPETANYNKSAYNTGTLLGSSLFDAKQ